MIARINPQISGTFVKYIKRRFYRGNWAFPCGLCFPGPQQCPVSDSCDLKHGQSPQPYLTSTEHVLQVTYQAGKTLGFDKVCAFSEHSIRPEGSLCVHRWVCSPRPACRLQSSFHGASSGPWATSGPLPLYRVGLEHCHATLMCLCLIFACL